MRKMALTLALLCTAPSLWAQDDSFDDIEADQAVDEPASADDERPLDEDPLDPQDSGQLYDEAFGKDPSEPEALPPFEPANSKEAREYSNVGLFYTYAPLGFLLSGRHGGELDWLINERWTLLLEYGKASFSASRFSFDIASFDETVYGAHARYYPGNSFNLQFGLGRRAHELKLGDDLISSGSKKISVEVSVVHLALGNRWQWANGISFGVDWLVLDIPFGRAKVDDGDITERLTNEDDREDVRDVLSAMRYVPTIAVARMGLGYVF